MTRLDPIIAVKDVAASRTWYEQVLGLKSVHGGDQFCVLTSQDGEILLCLHKWAAHDHPSLTREELQAGNGLLLYFRTHEMEEVYARAVTFGSVIEDEIHLNENSHRREFSLRDPDGYYITVSQYHEFEG